MFLQKGQLGHGDLCQRNVPTVVEALKGLTLTAGAAGKHHTVVVTSAGDSWAFGLNSTVRQTSPPPSALSPEPWQASQGREAWSGHLAAAAA